MKEERTPLKVTFTVSGGFVPPPLPLHLDALLAYHVTRQFAGRVANQPEADIAALREIAPRKARQA